MVLDHAGDTADVCGGAYGHTSDEPMPMARTLSVGKRSTVPVTGSPRTMQEPMPVAWPLFGARCWTMPETSQAGPKENRLCERC